MKNESTSDPLTANVRWLLAHDLKNPLSAAWTMTVLMQDMDDGSDPLASRSVEIVHSAVTRAMSWIEDMTLALGLETGQREVESTPSAAHAVVTLARETTSELDGIDRVEWPGRVDAYFEGEPELLARCIHALVSNALLHGGKDGPIEVSCRREQNQLLFDVMDRGEGIPPQRRDRLFLPLGSPERLEYKVGGVGLALCRAVAEAHGGSVGYTLDENGSSFRLCVPAVSA